MTRRNRYKRQADRMAISIDSPVGEDENITLSDIIADKATIEKIFFEEGYVVTTIYENNFKKKDIYTLNGITVRESDYE